MSSDDNFDPWGSPQPPKKKPSKPDGQKNQKSDDAELDEILKKFRQNTQNLFSNDPNNINPRLPFYIAGGVLVLWIIFSSIFFVGSGEKGVVLRFGEYYRTVESGLNFKLPAPFERSYVRNVENTNRVGVGEGNDQNLMVTGDENIVDVEFVVRWNIKNLEDFLFNISNPDQTARNAAESAMREVIGAQSMAFALGEGEGRDKISVSVQELLQDMLDQYGSGIRVVGVDLKKIDVPSEVVDAQIDVQNAKTEQQRVKNQAEAYRNDIIPRARGNAAKLVEDAEAYKQSVVAKAKGDTSRFTAVYDQYKNAKDVTRNRIYLETMQEVLRGMDKVIIDKNNNVVPYLPLRELQKKEEKANAQ